MAQRRPVYRRASWAQNDKAYKTYMRKDLAVDRSPGRDFGLENFSYDEAHLSEWQVPGDIVVDLPKELREHLHDWSAAGAAVCTALERVTKLYGESLYRGYPERRTSHLSRTASDPPSAVGSPISPIPRLPAAAVEPYDRVDSSPLVNVPPREVIGMESPPFTPLDSNAPGTPSGYADPSKPIQHPPHSQQPFDLARINTQLSISPPASRRDSSFSVTSAFSNNSGFDENAWETYMNCFRSELDDIRSHALVRFKGYGWTIDKLRVEYGNNPEYAVAIGRFNPVWAVLRAKIVDCERKVRDLELPDLEYVRMERMARGMGV